MKTLLILSLSFFVAPACAIELHCNSDASYCDEDGMDLSPAEEAAIERREAEIARIKARASDRATQKEAIRLSQCTIPWLHIGCPK